MGGLINCMEPSLKGSNGTDGLNGLNGEDGTNGVDFPAFSIITTTTGLTLDNTYFSGNKILSVNSASAVSITLNTGLTGVEPLLIDQKGAGQVTIAGTATLESRSGLKTAGQYAVITIIPKGADLYRIAGDTAA